MYYFGRVECYMASTSSPSTFQQIHNVFRVKKKLEIIFRSSINVTLVCLARFYNVGKTTITDIKKNREEIVSFQYKTPLSTGSMF